jgi:hypothetical protein
MIRWLLALGVVLAPLPASASIITWSFHGLD